MPPSGQPATLIYNARAGSSARAPVPDLHRALEDAGYHAALHVTPGPEALPELLRATTGTVFVAGGDGTIRSAALHLLNRPDVTLGVIPMGTANNVARALRLPLDPLAAARAHARTRPRPFDVGLVRGPWGEDHFIEACGCGLFADILDDYGPHLAKSPVRALGSMLEVFTRQQPLGVRVTVDGQGVPSPPLAVLEVMNTPSTGTGLHLAPPADPTDGQFTLVRMQALNREPLLEYAAAMLRGTFHTQPGVHADHGRVFTVADLGQVWHVDTDLRRSAAPGGVVEIRVQPGALRVLSPAN